MTGASINIMENLDLRAFLERQQVTTVVMEATGDFWKPFYYVLEDTCRFSWSMPRTHETSLAERLMCPMRHGWPNWQPVGYCGHLSCLGIITVAKRLVGRTGTPSGIPKRRTGCCN